MTVEAGGVVDPASSNAGGVGGGSHAGWVHVVGGTLGNPSSSGGGRGGSSSTNAAAAPRVDAGGVRVAGGAVVVAGDATPTDGWQGRSGGVVVTSGDVPHTLPGAHTGDVTVASSTAAGPASSSGDVVVGSGASTLASGSVSMRVGETAGFVGGDASVLAGDSLVGDASTAAATKQQPGASGVTSQGGRLVVAAGSAALAPPTMLPNGSFVAPSFPRALGRGVGGDAVVAGGAGRTVGGGVVITSGVGAVNGTAGLGVRPVMGGRRGRKSDATPRNPHYAAASGDVAVVSASMAPTLDTPTDAGAGGGTGTGAGSGDGSTGSDRNKGGSSGQVVVASGEAGAGGSGSVAVRTGGAAAGGVAGSIDITVGTTHAPDTDDDANDDDAASRNAGRVKPPLAGGDATVAAGSVEVTASAAAAAAAGSPHRGGRLMLAAGHVRANHSMPSLEDDVAGVLASLHTNEAGAASLNSVPRGGDVVVSSGGAGVDAGAGGRIILATGTGAASSGDLLLATGVMRNTSTPSDPATSTVLADGGAGDGGVVASGGVAMATGAVFASPKPDRLTRRSGALALSTGSTGGGRAGDITVAAGTGSVASWVGASDDDGSTVVHGGVGSGGSVTVAAGGTVAAVKALKVLAAHATPHTGTRSAAASAATPRQGYTSGGVVVRSGGMAYVPNVQASEATVSPVDPTQCSDAKSCDATMQGAELSLAGAFVSAAKVVRTSVVTKPGGGDDNEEDEEVQEVTTSTRTTMVATGGGVTLLTGSPGTGRVHQGLAETGGDAVFATSVSGSATIGECG